MNNETLQKKMIMFRAKKNISQKQLAKMCCLAEQTITNVENGVQNPSKLTQQKILNIIEN